MALLLQKCNFVEFGGEKIRNFGYNSGLLIVANVAVFVANILVPGCLDCPLCKYNSIKITTLLSDVVISF